MSKESLIEIAKELGFANNEIAVPLDEYFTGNNVIGSIIPNSYPDEVDPQKLYSFLKGMKENNIAQEVLVRICEIDEDWPYSDSIYVYTSLSAIELEKEFEKFSPDEICDGWMYGEPKGKVDILSPNKVYTIWWD